MLRTQEKEVIFPFKDNSRVCAWVCMFSATLSYHGLLLSAQSTAGMESEVLADWQVLEKLHRQACPVLDFQRHRASMNSHRRDWKEKPANAWGKAGSRWYAHTTCWCAWGTGTGSLWAICLGSRHQRHQERFAGPQAGPSGLGMPLNQTYHITAVQLLFLPLSFIQFGIKKKSGPFLCLLETWPTLELSISVCTERLES